MANETRTEAPLTATVGERVEEQAHQGDPTGVERAAAAVEDLRAAGYEGDRPGGRGRARRAVGRGSAIAWGVAAGVGMRLVAGMIGRVFRG